MNYRDLNDWLNEIKEAESSFSHKKNIAIKSLSAKQLMNYFFNAKEEDILAINRKSTKTKFLVASVDYDETSCIALFLTNHYNNDKRNADDALFILKYDLFYGEPYFVLINKSNVYLPENNFVFEDDDFDELENSLSHLFEAADIASQQKQFCNEFLLCKQVSESTKAECTLFVSENETNIDVHIFDEVCYLDDSFTETDKNQYRAIYLDRFVEVQNATSYIVYQLNVDKEYLKYYNITL